MIIRSTGAIQPEVRLLTLGSSCHYCLGDTQDYYLVDPGLTAHIPALLKRLNDSQYQIRNCRGILMTHLHEDRIAGIPLLRKLNPNIQLFASPQQKVKLSDESFLKSLQQSDLQLSKQFDVTHPSEPIGPAELKSLFSISRVISDSDQLRIADDINLRVLSLSGHGNDSLAFFIEPYNFLIIDETAGYYNGRNLASPGFDLSIEDGIKSLKKFLDLEIAALCLPYSGVLTANLVRKHLTSVIQNSEDLVTETSKALASGKSKELILETIKENLFKPIVSDPLLEWNMQRSMNELWKQLSLKNIES